MAAAGVAQRPARRMVNAVPEREIHVVLPLHWERIVQGREHSARIAEIRIGYDSIILANSLKAEAVNITLNQVWRAAAAVVPVAYLSFGTSLTWVWAVFSWFLAVRLAWLALRTRGDAWMRLGT